MTVYFIGMSLPKGLADGPVKIGWANNIRQRLGELQCATPWELFILREVAGGRRTERWLHLRYAARKVRGEWFIACPTMWTVEPPTEGLGTSSVRRTGPVHAAYLAAARCGSVPAWDARAVAAHLGCSAKYARDITADARAARKAERNRRVSMARDLGFSVRAAAKFAGISPNTAARIMSA